MCKKRMNSLKNPTDLVIYSKKNIYSRCDFQKTAPVDFPIMVKYGSYTTTIYSICGKISQRLPTGFDQNIPQFAGNLSQGAKNRPSGRRAGEKAGKICRIWISSQNRAKADQFPPRKPLPITWLVLVITTNAWGSA